MASQMMRWQPYKLAAVSFVCFFMVAGRGGSAWSTGTVTPGQSTGHGSVSLPFTTIVQGAAPGGAGAMPALRLVRTEAQRVALAARLGAFARPALTAVDLSTYMVIAAFQGLQPTSGYRIDILTLEVSGHTLEVMVTRSSPAPGEPVRHGFEFPYHVVQVVREALDVYQLSSYRLREASGEVLQEGSIRSTD